MRDMNLDWCFEGGCTDMADAGVERADKQDAAELEALYEEPCVGMYD